MAQHFTHLHLHTDYSLLDGAITIEKLVNFGIKQKLKALAISDHGNIFGAVKFFQQCKKASIKPILGMEAYFTEDARIKDIHNKYYHLLLLVENEIGYKNLCKLISFSYKEGFYFKPRIDYKILREYSEGLIATSACLGGHIPQLLINNQEDIALEKIEWFTKVFGPERFFLEVQPEDQKEQVALNKKLYEISSQNGIALVATGDCHYVSKNDHQAHEAMLAIQTQGRLSDPNRYTFGDCRVYMRNTQEMLESFPEHQEAVWNAGKIADLCTFEFPTGRLFFPQFNIPSQHTPESYFKYLCMEGFQRLEKLQSIPKESIDLYKDRLDTEINLISSMGFVEYFLVVSNFIQWAKQASIPVGPGRGSVAGSLVAWALSITNIDPIKYNLLFERFLNPERVTMPDIDIDFCIEKREDVINYVRTKYGHDKVCQIITFGTMMAKGVLKDVARVLGFSFEDSNALTNLIPDQLKITLEDALEQEPQLREMIKGNPRIKELFDLSFKLEGITRHASKHAAGIVISPEPIDEVLPIYIPPKSTELVTQYAMTELESLGFLKIDLLGLKNLTLIKKVIDHIKENHSITIDIEHLPLDDAKTFSLLARGNTSGVFQLESEGIKEVLRKLQPEKFEDIIAVNALYRPGPLNSGMVEDFIQRKHGKQAITYIFPELENILKETYGVIVYQEQVMKIASIIAGYSLGEADILRRAMGKKKVEVMAEQRKLFLDRAVQKGFNATKSGQLFDLMAYFAGYGFNKSHSAAYALIAYQTAFLKAHYPAEFMACLISLESQNADKMVFYLHESKEMGLMIAPPDINISKISFSVVHTHTILFGLHGIKNVGQAALTNIISQRADKPFLDLLDFCFRVDLRTVNKRVIEHLIAAGALDSLPGNRAQKTAELNIIINQAIEKKRAQETGQLDLFGNHKQNNDVNSYTFSPLDEWSDKEKLDKEKHVIGFYISAHPLDTYKIYFQRFNVKPFSEAISLARHTTSSHDSIVTCYGLLKQRKDIVTKKGERMSFVQLEDAKHNNLEVVLFPRLFKNISNWLETYTTFVIQGTIDSSSSQKYKLKAQQFIPIELLLQEWKTIKSIICVLPEDITQELVSNLKNNLIKGTIPLIIHLGECKQLLEIKTKKKIGVDYELINQIEELGAKIIINL